MTVRKLREKLPVQSFFLLTYIYYCEEGLNYWSKFSQTVTDVLLLFPLWIQRNMILKSHSYLYFTYCEISVESQKGIITIQL